MKTDELPEDKPYYTFEYNGRTVKLLMAGMDEEIDPERITYIDMNNIVGEIVTFPRIMNKLGNLKAEANHALAKAKLQLEIVEHEFKDDLRTNYESPNLDAKGKDKGWTNDQVHSRWRASKKYALFSKKYNQMQFNFDVLDSTYWAAKDKSDKLNSISQKLERDDLNSLKSGTINGIKIIVKNKLFD